MNPKPRKARRISRACDFCHRRGIRCRASHEEDSNGCQNCVDFDQACTYDRPAKRRGAKKGQQRSFQTTPSLASEADVPPPAQYPEAHSRDGATLQPSSHSDLPNLSAGDVPPSAPKSSWHAPAVASQAVIMDLVEVYFEVVYPM